MSLSPFFHCTTAKRLRFKYYLLWLYLSQIALKSFIQKSVYKIGSQDSVAFIVTGQMFFPNNSVPALQVTHLRN